MPITKNSFQRYQIIDHFLKGLTPLSIVELTKKVNQELKEKGHKEVSDRQIRKDIQFIQDNYFDKVFIRVFRGKYIYEDHNTSINQITFNKEDREILVMAQKSIALFGGEMNEKFNSLIQRVLETDTIRKFKLNDPSQYIQLGEKIESSGYQWLERLYRAIIDRRAQDMQYQPYGKEPKNYTISPYLLKEYRNQWYVIAYAPEIRNGFTNVFKLSRIQSLENSLGEYFEDISFNKTNYFRYSLGIFHRHDLSPIEVTLRFGNNLVNLIRETKLHPTMEILSQTPDEITVSITVYDTIDLQTLIMGYGSEVEILSPENLRKKIQNELKKTLNFYDNN